MERKTSCVNCPDCVKKQKSNDAQKKRKRGSQKIVKHFMTKKYPTERKYEFYHFENKDGTYLIKIYYFTCTCCPETDLAEIKVTKFELENPSIWINMFTLGKAKYNVEDDLGEEL